MKFKRYLTELAKGWTKDSVEKFAKTIGFKSAKDEGFFDACVTRLENDGTKDPKGLCAEMKDKVWGTTMWRGKGKKKEDVKK